MSRSATLFLFVIAPALAILLALLGIETLPANPLGWYLLLIGIGYTAGLVIAYAVRKERFWEAASPGTTTQEEHGDCSLWFVIVGVMVAFYLPPVEYLYIAPILPRNDWLTFGGAVLVAVGIALFVWARRALGQNYSGHVSIKAGQALVQNGPYHFIRHPAYAGYLCMALGIGLGYSSLVGLASTLVLLLPSLIYRMRVEEMLLRMHFGEVYRHYADATKRLIPGIW